MEMIIPDEIKITVFSDTHTFHEKLKMNEGNLLICAGDVTNIGSYTDVKNFIVWFAKQKYDHKIFIAGNHDFYFEEYTIEEINQLIIDLVGPNSGITYLNDSGVSLYGLNIWGSPVQPRFYDWAFNRDRGNQIKKHWDLIPKDTDILITHGPCYGIVDMNNRGEHTGCKDLLNSVLQISPKINVCGHIHEAYGYHDNGTTLFINASMVDYRNIIKNNPIDLCLNTHTKETRFI